jgi:hypothetical protein
MKHGNIQKSTARQDQKIPDITALNTAQVYELWGDLDSDEVFYRGKVAQPVSSALGPLFAYNGYIYYRDKGYAEWFGMLWAEGDKKARKKDVQWLIDELEYEESVIYDVEEYIEKVEEIPLWDFPEGTI